MLGDLDLPQPFEMVFATILDLTEVWFIHGNHDTDHVYYYDNVFHSALSDRNLHGKVINIGGVPNYRVGWRIQRANLASTTNRFRYEVTK